MSSFGGRFIKQSSPCLLTLDDTVKNFGDWILSDLQTVLPLDEFATYVHRTDS